MTCHCRRYDTYIPHLCYTGRRCAHAHAVALSAAHRRRDGGEHMVAVVGRYKARRHTPLYVRRALCKWAVCVCVCHDENNVSQRGARRQTA